jgi:class 3 adenylate cyclase/tetratricopeptide (TPR) repeat protein
VYAFKLRVKLSLGPPDLPGGGFCFYSEASKMNCPKCQAENPEQNQFCCKCGTKLSLNCPNCSAAILLADKFCGKCGHDLGKLTEAPEIDFHQPQSYTPKFLADKILNNRTSIEGERKLVTVLFADVADYTSMAEKLDPEEVHQIMDGCFKVLMEEIHSYEGTINQFTGDGVMALFGAPVAHEDHAQRACHAALSIQKAIAEYGKNLKNNHEIEFKMRIGLNSGPVIVGSIGDDLRMDYTAVGDTTNLAARMEGMANSGSILVTDYTHKLARDFFEFMPLGKAEVKGKEAPVEVYELKKAGEVETRIEAAAVKGLTKFAGRKNAMTALMEAYRKAKNGSGQVVGVVGEAGVGKSRLLIELRNKLANEEYTYLEGRCLHYGGCMAYLPIHDILKSYFEIKKEDQEPVIKKKMADKISHFDERLKSVLSPFQEMLSGKVEDDIYLQLEPAAKKIRTFEAIRDLVVCESENKPVVFAVEDLHWIDRLSEEFLNYLIDWLAGTRILLILLYRPEYTHQWGNKSFYSKIGVVQLGTKSSAQLVQNILEGGEVVPELKELIHKRAGGNPLFVEELTHSLMENGSIQKKDFQYVFATKTSEIKVPDTIQGIIAARIDRIEENLKRILQVASVIGREFAYRILQAITEMREELKSSLVNLQGLELIYEKSLFPELEYIFKHALTQEVAYNSLLVKRRKEIHEKIGNAIEELYPERLEEYYELLAYHYTLSDNKEKAVAYLDLANQKAAKLDAMEEAEAYFDEAMALLDTLPETKENRQRRISLLVSQGEVFMLLLKMPQYCDLLTRYEPTARELGNPELLGALYGRLGQCEYSFGKYDQAIHSLGKAAKLFQVARNIEDAGYAYVYWEYCHLDRGDFERVLSLKEDVLRTMEHQFNLRVHTYALSGASRAYACLGRWDEAVEEAQKALTVAQKHSDNSMISFVTWNLSIAYTLKGDLARAVEYGKLAVQKSLTPGDKAWAQRSLGWIWCRSGELNRGIELLTAVLPIFRAGRFINSEIPLACFLGEGYWMAGEDNKARQTLEEGLGMAERCGVRYYAGFAHRLLGESVLKTSPTQAAPHYEKSIAIFQEIKAENELAMAYAGYGRLHKKQGKNARAREYLTMALEIFERLGTLIEPEKVREILAELPEA